MLHWQLNNRYSTIVHFKHRTSRMVGDQNSTRQTVIVVVPYIPMLRVHALSRGVLGALRKVGTPGVFCFSEAIRSYSLLAVTSTSRLLAQKKTLGHSHRSITITFTGEALTSEKMMRAGIVQMFYEGERLHGKPHGKGKLTYGDGRSYDGRFENGKKRGYGVETYSDGTMYSGKWMNDLQHGNGTLIYADGSKYEGAFFRGNKHGQGRSTSANGVQTEDMWIRGRKSAQTSEARVADDGKPTMQSVVMDEDIKRITVVTDTTQGTTSLVTSDSATSPLRAKRKYERKGKVVNRNKLTTGEIHTLKLADGSVYKGELKDGLMHGYGNMVNIDGSSYVGTFENGKYHGVGQLRYLNKDMYYGNFENGLQHGAGALTYHVSGLKFESTWTHGKAAPTGVLKGEKTVYTGEVNMGMKHGKGELVVESSKTTYTGDWENDQQQGKGLLKYKDGSTYEGDFVQGSKHGFGRSVGADGTVYEGDWWNNQQEGKGKIFYPNGDIFEGTFFDGEKHGMGITTRKKDGAVIHSNWERGRLPGKLHEGRLLNGKCLWTYSSGCTYDGDWVNGKRHGKGTLTYPDGGVYEGEFENDKPSGQGRCIYGDKGVYEGEWLRGNRHGSGRHTDKNGNIFEGNWVNNRLHGRGKVTTARQTYVGDFERGRQIGVGVFTYSGGGVFQGEVFEGKRHGFGRLTYPTGAYHEGTWKHNRKEGPAKYITTDGRTLLAEYKGDKIWNGMATVTFKDGSVYIGEWLNGNMHGQGKKTYKDGVVLEGTWEHNRCDAIHTPVPRDNIL